MTLKLSKCRFGLQKVDLLGYEVTPEGIAPQEQKTKVIARLATPAAVKEVCTFLGMCGYYRQCIPGFAEIAEPLQALTKKSVRFDWNEDRQKSFDRLKAMLCSAHVMIHPDTQQEYQLHTDASDFAVGAILTQERGGIDRPMQYVSKALTDSQRK